MINHLDIDEISFRREERTDAVDRKKLSRVVNDYIATTETHCLVHVQDGKPLTAIGARLLRIPWRGRE